MQSRGEAILRAIIDGGSASDLPAPQSRVEALLLELLESGAGGSLAIHVCTVDEYDAETGVPTVQDPDEKTIYLVPGDNETGSDLYIEWIYVDSNWEQFGSATIDLSDYALKSDLTGVVYNNTYATTSTGGAVKYNTSKGISVDNAGILTIYPAESGTIKSGSDTYKPIVPATQHEAAFYGLAEAAGDLTQISSSNAVGTYTDNAKSAIRRMIGAMPEVVDEVVSGTAVTISAQAGKRYLCGEVSTVSFTPSQSGICEVIFTSGSSVAILTLPNTVKMPDWFDPTSLDTNTVYEISIADGVYGAVMTWAA